MPRSVVGNSFLRIRGLLRNSLDFILFLPLSKTAYYKKAKKDPETARFITKFAYDKLANGENL